MLRKEKNVIHKKVARSTLTAVEMDRRDELQFTLASGQVRQIELISTNARLISTELKKVKHEEPAKITVIGFSTELLIDGETVTFQREIGSQASFYEPYEVAGMRIWPDAVDDVFEFVDETHGACRPRKHARFAIQDATLDVCPEPLHPWCPLPVEGLDIRECYNGDDCWMGPYFGASAHGGLDINQPAGTPIWAPVDLDDHWFFNTQAEHGNNRWRGVHKWPDGATWILQVCHVIRLLVGEHTPQKTGTHIAEGAGVAVGTHDHSHFGFAVQEEGAEPILLDPWILFREMYGRQDQLSNCFFSRKMNGGIQKGNNSEPIRFGAT